MPSLHLGSLSPPCLLACTICRVQHMFIDIVQEPITKELGSQSMLCFSQAGSFRLSRHLICRSFCPLHYLKLYFATKNWTDYVIILLKNLLQIHAFQA